MPELAVCRERILSEDYRDFIVRRLRENIFDFPLNEDICKKDISVGFEVVYVDKERADPIDLGRYPYYSIPKCYTLIDTEALEQAGILQIQNYPTLGLQGNGVMIGFVDTGIDYNNPIFRNIDGSTRIAGIWDQTIQLGEPPEGFLYGTEYTREMIDRALRQENSYNLVPSVDSDGHGTFLASVACGGADEVNQFLGAAPEATIAVVKLKPAKEYLKQFYLINRAAVCYQENDIMLGMEYLQQLATQNNMPLVICIALGTNLGSHNAISALSGLAEVYSNTVNTAVVVGTGNEANQRHHYQGRAEDVRDVKEVEVRVGSEVSGFVMELWTDIPDIMAVSIVSPSGERISSVSVRRNVTEVYELVFEGTKISINYKLLVENSNAELIFLRLEAPTEGVWRFQIEPLRVAEGIFHIWLPMTEFLTGEVYFLQSNPDYTITEPGNTLSAITVGYYNGNDNGIAIRSGRGYTRGERIKPDFVAPGVNVTGATSRNQFVERTGSSIAVGITAGAAALMMEWIVYQLGEGTVDAIRIRNLLILGTERNPNENYPNRKWGYGRLNLYNSFDVLRRF